MVSSLFRARLLFSILRSVYCFIDTIISTGRSHFLTAVRHYSLHCGILFADNQRICFLFFFRLDTHETFAADPGKEYIQV